MRDLVYIFDAPIRADDKPCKTIKILACNTKNLVPQTFQSAINPIKAQKNSPSIYTFSEVNEAMFQVIKDCFSDNEYFFSEKLYPESSNLKLITVFKEGPSVRFPTLIENSRIPLQIQTFICSGSDTGEQFILHVGHLEPSDQLREAEEQIIDKIFHFLPGCSYGLM